MQALDSRGWDCRIADMRFLIMEEMVERMTNKLTYYSEPIDRSFPLSLYLFEEPSLTLIFFHWPEGLVFNNILMDLGDPNRFCFEEQQFDNASSVPIINVNLLRLSFLESEEKKIISKYLLLIKMSIYMYI